METFKFTTTIEFKHPRVSIINDKRHQSIRRKRLGKLPCGVILVHDNARSHVANATKENIEQKKWKILEHPPYSPDL